MTKIRECDIKSLFPLQVDTFEGNREVNCSDVESIDNDESTLFKCKLHTADRSNTISFCVPKIDENGITRVHGIPYGIANLMKLPIIQFSNIYDNIHMIIFNPFYSDGKIIQILLNHKKDFGVFIWNKTVTRCSIDNLSTALNGINVLLHINERNEINRVLNIKEDSIYLTPKDIKLAIDYTKYDYIDTDINDINNRLVFGYKEQMYSPEILIMKVRTGLIKALKRFAGEPSDGDHTPRSNYVEKEIFDFFYESPYAQLVNIDNELDIYDISRKLYREINNPRDISERNPHPSMKFVLSPIDTPQSENCGIVMRMCEGIKVKNGKLTGKSSSILGVAPSAIPFVEHNDPNRILMCSSILRHAVNIEANEKPLVSTDNDIPDPPGTNARVAYMVFHGWNYEDNVLISKSLQDRLSTKILTKQHYYSTIIYPAISVKEGDKIKWNDIIGVQIRKLDEHISELEKSLVFETTNNYRKIYLINHAKGTSKIKEIRKYITYRNNQKVFVTEIVTIKHSPCKIGDKLSNRYANKGIISQILPDEKMPKDKDGKHVELLINFITVFSRKNLGQIYETILGRLCHDYGNGKQLKIVQLSDIDWRQTLTKSLQNRNLDISGKIQLYDMYSRPYKYKTLVGWQFIMRLDKHSEEILDIRNEEVRNRDGFNVNSQRIGLMEIAALKANKMDKMLEWVGRQSMAKEHVSEILKAVNLKLLV